MEKITTKEQAIEFLEQEIGLNVDDLSKWKYRIYDNDVDFCVKTDEELIDYANEQKEAVE